ncbi:hypothetical protein BDC45DRAFT_517855 [Circinella umbellata]|nr:hypothetical protein BDC45DRAFT_517855 [Circinella umbellata]
MANRSNGYQSHLFVIACFSFFFFTFQNHRYIIIVIVVISVKTTSSYTFIPKHMNIYYVPSHEHI